MTIQDQPPPIPSDRVAIVDLVVADMVERKRVGTERYGTPLQAFNGRDPLVDAYQEALDLVMYIRQAIEERTWRRLQAGVGEVDEALVQRLAQALLDVQGDAIHRAAYPLSDFHPDMQTEMMTRARAVLTEVD